MMSFPLLDETNAHDPIVMEVYAEIRRELGFGMVPNIFCSMSIRPTLLRAFWDMFRATMLQGYIPRTLKEMLGVLISHEHESEYALRVHMHGLSVVGISAEILHTLVYDFKHCPLPEREKAVLRFGLRVATNPQSVDEEDYALLRAYDLQDVEIFEIIATAQLFVLINTYTDSVGVPVDSLV